MSRLNLSTKRGGYSPEQCGRTLTVAEIVEILQQYDDETPVYFSNDNGYTYGSLMEGDFDYIDEEDSDEDN